MFTPSYKPYVEFQSGEEINNWLLENAEVRAYIGRSARPGVRPKVAMVFFDEETERIRDELGYDLILPTAELRNHLDSKLVTTRLGNEVGVPSVPNTIATVGDWEELVQVAENAGLAPTWLSRRRTATRARPRSSSRRRLTGASTARRSSATRSR